MTRIRLSGSARPTTRKDLQEQLSLALAVGEGEDLLELIDDEHDLGVAGHRQVDRLEQAAGVRPPAGRGAVRRGAIAMRRSAASSSSIGCAPGNISATNHVRDPASAPARIPGTTPARTTEDFPLPLGPTTARNPAPAPASRARR